MKSAMRAGSGLVFNRGYLQGWYTVKGPTRVLAVLGLSLIGVVTACASGQKQPYHNLLADLPASGERTLAVATHDQRSYVKNEDKKPDFVGLHRAGYGNPFDVTTESGHPLAADFTASIKSSLQSKGLDVVSLATRHDQSRGEILKDFLETGADRLALLTLLEWKSDTYGKTTLVFDATLAVYDNMGSMLAESRIEGREDLGGKQRAEGGFFFTLPEVVKYARQAVAQAAVEKLETLFEDPEIQKAIR